MFTTYYLVQDFATIHSINWYINWYTSSGELASAKGNGWRFY
jgi:hypothetical protein